MDDLLQQGIAALKAGDKARARRVLTRALEANPRSEQAWLWLSGAVDTDSERLMCLERVLSINPNNERARKGATVLRQRQQEQAITSEGYLPPSLGSAATQIAPEGVADDLDHSRRLSDLSPEMAQALRGFSTLVIHELAGKRSRQEIIERLAKRGFPRTAVAEFVDQIANQPRPMPTRYERALEAEVKDSIPWLTIWIKPRVTIRYIVNTDPTRHVLLNVTLLGLFAAVDWWLNTNTVGASSQIPLLPQSVVILQLVLGIVGALVISVIYLYVFGGLWTLVGRWVGGCATAAEVRAAIAWGSAPRLWLAVLWIPRVLLYAYANQQGGLINVETGDVTNPSLLAIILVLAGIELIVSLWTFVVLLKCLGEVNRFSAWRAWGVMILGNLVLMIPVCALIGVALGLMAQLT